MLFPLLSETAWKPCPERAIRQEKKRTKLRERIVNPIVATPPPTAHRIRESELYTRVRQYAEELRD